MSKMQQKLQIPLLFIKHNENEQLHNRYHVSIISKEELDKIIPVSPPIVNKKINPKAHNKISWYFNIDYQI